MRLQDVFKMEKPIIAMLHLKGKNPEDIFQRAKRETDLLFELGVDSIIVEDFFGTQDDVLRVLEWLHGERPHYCYGVNILHRFDLSFDAAQKYGAKFIQTDSIAGHLPPEEDQIYGENAKALQEKNSLFIMGGVRFKYMPVLSGRSVEEDLRIGMDRCHAIVVTGAGTGIPTETKKVRKFREILGDFPLLVGAGLTDANVKKKLRIADGGIVGSYLKEGGKAEGDVDPKRVRKFMKQVQELREERE